MESYRNSIKETSILQPRAFVSKCGSYKVPVENSKNFSQFPENEILFSTPSESQEVHENTSCAAKANEKTQLRWRICLMFC